MIKRIMLLLCLGVFMITALEARQRQYSKQGTMTLPLTDSVIAETLKISTPAYYNRVYARVIFRNFVDTTGTGTDFGDEDSMIVKLWSVYGDIYRLIDEASLVYVAADIPTAGTLTVKTDYNHDSLFTEKLFLEIYFADTSSAQTGELEIPFEYQLIHTFGGGRE